MDSNLRKRVITGVLMAALFLTLLLYNIVTVQALFIIIMYCLLFEFLTISVSELTGAVAHLFWAFVGTSGLLLYLVYKDPNNFYFQIMNVVCLAYIVLNVFLLLSKHKTTLPKVPSMQAFLYISIPSFILIHWIRNTESYQSILLAVFLMIWLSDTAAYFVGKTFGKRKLFPSISPNKTWAGFLGAGIFTIAGGFVASYLSQDLTLVDWLSLALIIWIFGSIGDLVESSFKRHYSIKDSGTILAGHGGFLDRLDSFIFSIPVIIFYLTYLSNGT